MNTTDVAKIKAGRRAGGTHAAGSSERRGQRTADTSRAQGTVATVHKLLRCVWSGYPARGDRCHARVPAAVAAEAWEQETALAHRAEGFFYFAWHNGQWLAYGAPDGSVRGVYCAAHCAERAARILDYQRDSLPDGMVEAAEAG